MGIVKTAVKAEVLVKALRAALAGVALTAALAGLRRLARRR